MINPKNDFYLKRKIKEGVSFAMTGASWLSRPLGKFPDIDNALDLKSFLNLMPESVIGVSKDGRIVVWNKAAEALFGWSEREAAGQPMDQMIIPEDYRQLHNNGMKRMLETGESRVTGKNLDLQALNKKGDQFPIKLCISSTGNSDVSYLGFIHENANEIKVQKELSSKLMESEVLLQLMDLMVGSYSVDEILQKSVQVLSEKCGREVGHVYEQSEQNCVWSTKNIWNNSTGLPIKSLMEDSTTLDSEAGPWSSKELGGLSEVSWIADIQEVKPFKRQVFLREFGFSGAVLLPIKVDGEVEYVMEFFSLEKLGLTPKCLKFLSDVSVYIGKAISLKI